MHPAGSIIYFTVASGFGFGFLFFLGLNISPLEGQGAFWRYFLAYGLAVSGLLSSLLHLGNPQRAWKALSQWHTSWLSREGVAAIAALVALVPLSLGHIFIGADFSSSFAIYLGILGAILSGITVYCTAMIYGQLKTVPRWHQPLTPVLFLAFSFSGGAMLAQIYGAALIGLLALFALQIAHWMLGDRCWHHSASTMETATGLGAHEGQVRLLERPHTGKSYLTSEMVHQIGRKHGVKLRGLTLILLLSTGGALHIETYGLWLGALILGLAALVSRWLFFAEAEHVVGLYYGRPKTKA